MIIRDGDLLGYLGRTRQTVTTFAAESVNHDTRMRPLAKALRTMAVPGRSMLIAKVDGIATADSPLATVLIEEGFMRTTKGFLHKGNRIE
ncbi:MAG: hypothetical protein R3C19_14895 [Planctomycetaceae bacterium]